MEELITVIVGLAVTGVFGLLGKYLLNLSYVKGNERTERTIRNGMGYAERWTEKILSTKAVEKVAGWEKMNKAIKYIEKIDPAMFKKYGDKLELMIERSLQDKLEQKDTKVD